jgi:hypothetical protein
MSAWWYIRHLRRAVNHAALLIGGCRFVGITMVESRTVELPPRTVIRRPKESSELELQEAPLCGGTSYGLTFIRALALTSAPNFSYICLDDDHTDIQSVKQLRRAVSSVSLATRRLGLKITTQACQEVIANAGFIPAPSRDTGSCVCIRENKKQQFVPLGAGSLDMAAPLL